MTAPRMRLDPATALALASALAAGAEELAWSRLFGRVVGHGSVALGLSLGVFMAGQGAGALLAGRLRARVPSARAAFQGAETITGLSALGVLALLWLGPLPSTLSGLEGGPVALALDVGVLGMTTLVPALAMGAALPFLSEASAGAGAPSLARLYGAGLLGAVVGTLGGAILVAPSFGLDALALGAAVVHLLCAVGGRALAPSEKGAETEPSAPTAKKGAETEPSAPTAKKGAETEPSAPSSRVVGRRRAPRTRVSGARSPDPSAARAGAALRFAVAGSIGLGLQPIWARCIVPYAGVASLTFASLVAAYVASQALGFALFARLRDRRLGRLGPDDVALLLAAPGALLTLGLLTPLSELAPDRSSGALAFATLTPLVVLVVVGPSALLLGVAQAGALGRIEGDDEARGARLAWVSGLGTLASAAAALGSGLLAMPLLGPHLGIAALGALAAAVVGVEHLGAAALALGAAVALVVARPGPDHFLGRAYDDEELVYVEHGLEDTTAVVRHVSPLEGPLLRLVSSGVSYSGDSRFAQRYMRLLGHLPALEAAGRERALVVCVGTGTTLDALRLHDFAAVDAVDLSPSVARTLEHFRHVHHDVTDDPRVHFITEDGARHLASTRRLYDVITLEPPPPRAPGASALYSRELYQAARARLAPGGAIAQWLPLHGLGAREARAIVRTMAEVLPGVALHLVERNEAVLIARLGPASPPERALPDAVRRDLAGIGLGGVEPRADTLLLGGDALLSLVRDAPVIRDAWPYPELVPLADPGPGLDVFLEALGGADPRREGATSAERLGAIAPAFVRLSEGRGAPGDREALLLGMGRIFEARPDDPYWSVLRPPDARP